MNASPVVGRWLLACCVLLLGLVVLGGVTRLTGSGLSIVEWRPVTGVVPPLDDAGWERAFSAYRASPEGRLVNADMTLDGFRRIYWMEYLHRLWGRLVGLAVLVPLVWFAVRRRLPREVLRSLLVVLFVGALQGAVGWFMVRSGLEHRPHVSAVRLALHLALGLALFGLLLWTALDALRGTGPVARARRGWRVVLALSAGAALVVTSGGLVAGTHAGRAYVTFPLMAGELVPPGLFVLEPAWRNVVENVLLVQFQHRVLALGLAATLLVTCIRLRREHVARAPLVACAALAVAQPALGVATLLLHLPLALAALHQLGGFLLVGATLWLAHALRHPHAVVLSPFHDDVATMPAPFPTRRHRWRCGHASSRS